MMGCTLAAQTDQHSCPPSSLAGHRPACQHASMPQLGVPACWHARVHASTGMLSIRGCTRGCWPFGHSPDHESQCGFRPNKECTDGLLDLVGITARLSEGIRPRAQVAAVESNAEVRGADEAGIFSEGTAQDGEG